MSSLLGSREMEVLCGCLYADPPSATQQFFLKAKYVRGDLTSDRDSKSVLLTSLHALNWEMGGSRELGPREHSGHLF